MSRVHVTHRSVAGALLAAIAVFFGGSVAATASTLRFSAPAQIAGPPYASTHALTALDCPSETLCVAGDSAGNLVTTAAPTSGASAWTLAAEVDPSTRINAVSCASRSFCLAAGNDGSVIHSTDPTGGASAWRTTPGVLGSGNAFTALHCVASTLCFGVDRRGQVAYSRTPAGAARSWKFAHVLTTRNDWLVGIDCPTRSECAAIDRRGHAVLHSTRPTGGRTAWHATTLATKANATSFPAISCASRSLCVIAGGQGAGQIPFIATATRPTGGAAAWRVGKPPKAIENLVAVSCPTTSLCVVGGRTFGTELAYSTRPAAGASSYRAGLRAPTNPPTGYPAVNALSCPTRSRCVFIGPGGQAAATSTPTTTSTADWPAAVVDADNPLSSVSCPSATECLAGGNQMLVHTSADPTGGASAWGVTTLPIASDRVACGAIDECVVGDGTSGDLAATTTPLTGGWIEAETSGDLPDGGGIAVLSCAAGPFCLAGPYEVQSDSDDEGTSSLTTSDPTGGTDAWKYDEWLEGGVNGGPHPAKGTVTALSCVSSALCVAGDAAGGILTNVTPTRVGGWRYVQADGTASIRGLSCPSASLCVGVDSRGRVIDSTKPTAGHWASATIDRGAALTAVSCASTGFCVAVDGRRHAFVATLPTGGAGAWRRITGIDGDLTAIDCPTSTLCVAVDSQGNEVTARP